MSGKVSKLLRRLAAVDGIKAKLLIDEWKAMPWRERNLGNVKTLIKIRKAKRDVV